MIYLHPEDKKACSDIECKECYIANGSDDEAKCLNCEKLLQYYKTLQPDHNNQ